MFFLVVQGEFGYDVGMSVLIKHIDMKEVSSLRGRFIYFAILCLLFLPTQVYAQSDVVEDRDIRRTEKQIEIQEAIRNAAKQAALIKSLENKETVTYQDVLKDPDNILLNFRYAQAQVNRGDMVGASATLERILMVNPDLVPIRLFMANVLFQLDNLEEAKREFEILKEADLKKEQAMQVDLYLTQIKRRQSPLTLTASTAIGWGFDTNRNAAPQSKKRMVFGTPIGLTGTSKRRRDTNTLVSNSFGFEKKLATQAGHSVFGGLSYFLGEQTVADDLDLQSFGGNIGMNLQTPLGTLIPSLSVSQLYLSRETFMNSLGAKLGWNKQIGDKLTATISGGWTREDFRPIKENAAAADRKGGRTSGSIGASYVLAPNMQLGVNVDMNNKSIDDDSKQYNAYEGYGLTGSHTWLVGEGQFFLSSASYTVNGYDKPDRAISSRKRQDRQYSARFTYGAPLKLWAGWLLPEFLTKDVTMTATFEQSRTHSNITNYTYKNSKISTMLSRRIEF